MRSFKDNIHENAASTGDDVSFFHQGKLTRGKVVRYDKGDPCGSHVSEKVPAHKIEKYHGKLEETVDPKFERATKTPYHYMGRIGGKTYVVPHSYNYEGEVSDKMTPMHHHIVVSLNHTIHNNPTLSPEEHARVHSHIKDIHGGQEPAKLEEGMGQHQVPVYHSDRKTLLGHVASSATSIGAAKAGKAKNASFEKVDGKYAWVTSGATGHHGKRSNVGGGPYLPNLEEAEVKAKPVKGTPEYQAARDKYRHPALAASRKAATLAFAKKHHIINEKEDTMNEGVGVFHGVATYHQTKIAKQTLRMPDAMVGVMGGGSKEDARAHLKRVGWTDKQIHNHEHYKEEAAPNPKEQGKMLHCFTCGKMRIFKDDGKLKCPVCKTKKVIGENSTINERSLSPAEDTKKEEIVHSMKKKLQGFKERYGDKAKSVMYATATKQAKRLAEEVHAYDVHHKGKHIDTIFYGHPEPVEAVKKSLVNHDGYHPDITVKKQRSKPGKNLAYNVRPGTLKEEVHAYDVHHQGKHIDTVFYGHHEDPAEVKKSLVNHDGYHPNITVKKQPQHRNQGLESARWDKQNKNMVKEALANAGLDESNLQEYRYAIGKETDLGPKTKKIKSSRFDRKDESSQTFKTVKAVLHERLHKAKD